MKLEKPWYTLRIEASGPAYDIRVNDCPIWSGEKGGSVVTELPINKWIVNGSNQVTIHFAPSDKNEGKVSAAVRIREMGAPKSSAQEIAKVRTDEKAKQRPSLADLPSMKLMVEEKFKADVPFPPWKYTKTKAAPLTDSDRKEITALAKSLWQALSDKKIEKVLELKSEKIADLAVAGFETVAETRETSKQEYLSFINDPTMHIFKFYDDELKFVSYSNGQLIQLQDGKTGESPILFTDKEETISSLIDVFFYKDKNGKWSIIR